MVLVGLMGAGKTTVGRLVAEQTGRRLVDTDDAIRSRTGKTVRELWEEGGEAAYRKLESSVVLDGLAEPGGQIVIAAPGGAVLDPEVRAALARPGVRVVWLHADPAALAARVYVGDHRPLLGDHPAEVLQRMEGDRAAVYGSVADMVVETGGRGPAAVASEVVAAIEADRPG